MESQKTIPIIGIVDDDESVRDGISNQIKSAGYGVAVFESADAFLSSSRMHEMDCLIIDIQMPGLDGLGLQRKLVEKNHRIPIIFVSAHAGELRETALRHGAVAVLEKPLSDEALLNAIRSALGVSGHY